MCANSIIIIYFHLKKLAQVFNILKNIKIIHYNSR